MGHIICHACCVQRLDSNNLFTCICGITYRIQAIRELEETDLEFKTRSISVLPPNDQFILMMYNGTTPGPKPTKVEDVTPGYMCEQHGQPVHSFAEKPFTFICNQCKLEYSDINLRYREIPQIVNHLRDILTDGKKSLENKTRVYHGMKANTLGEKHWLSLTRRMDNHFESLKRLVEDLRTEGLDNLSDRKDKIKALADILCKPINDKLNEQRIHIAEVRELQRLSDMELAPKYGEASLLEIAASQDLAYLNQHVSGISVESVDIARNLNVLSSNSVNISTRPFEKGRSLPI
jgi:hypothetical protein